MLRIARHGWVAMLALSVTILLTTRASAQERFKQVPDPVTVAEFNQLLDLYVHPAKEQTEAIEKLHDAYRERFHTLRENEIAQFLAKKWDKWNDGSPVSEQIEAYTKGYEHVLKQVSDIDDSLFTGVAELIGEERRESVQRARNARIRECSTSKYMLTLLPIEIVDLSAILRELRLSAEERGKLDPALILYEQQLTDLMKDLAISSIRNRREMDGTQTKTTANAFPLDEKSTDEEKAVAAYEAKRRDMQRASESLRTKCKRFTAFNDAACKTLAAHLSDENQRWLRNEYVARTYPRLFDLYLMSHGMYQTDVLFRKALRTNTLAEPVLEQIRTAYRQWQAADEALVDQGIKNFNQQRVAHDLDAFSWEANNQIRAMNVELENKRKTLGYNALKSVSSLLDNPNLKSLFEKDPAEQRFLINEDAMVDHMVENPGAWTQPQLRQREVAMSTPLKATAMTALAARLALNDSQKALLNTMHADYLNHCEEMLRPTLDKFLHAAAERFMVDPQTQNSIPRPDRMGDFLVQSKILSKQMSEADAAFFSDLTLALGEKYAGALQMAKLERVMNYAVRSGFSTVLANGESVQERSVNIAELLRDPGLSAQDQAKVYEAIHVQIGPLISSLLNIYWASLDLERQEVAAREEMKANATPEENKNGIYKHQEAFLSVRQRLGKMDRQYLAAIRPVWTAALEPLSEAQRADLQITYDEYAYEGYLFDQECSAQPYIQAAQKLKDLTDEQKSKLQTLQTSSRTEYARLWRTLIPKDNAGDELLSSEESWKRYKGSIEAQGKIRFESDENDQQAIRELRRILTEEQAKKIRGLASYEKRAAETVARRKEEGH